MIEHEGRLVAPPAEARVGIVVARFNELITERLLEGALAAWKRHGGALEQLEVARVPGAFEIPVVAQRMANSQRFSAVVALGCVIRGSTGHYEYVCGPVASALMQAGVQSGVPVIFGVLTTENIEQALERAGSKAGNKGAEAMTTALEMMDLFEKIPTR